MGILGREQRQPRVYDYYYSYCTRGVLLSDSMNRWLNALPACEPASLKPRVGGRTMGSRTHMYVRELTTIANSEICETDETNS